MGKQLPRYTLRISAVLLEKLGYIAEFEGRTKTGRSNSSSRSASPHLRLSTA